MNKFMQLQNGSDIRGVAIDGVEGEEISLTTPIARTIGLAFGEWLSDQLEKPSKALKVSIGNDSRLSANAIKEAVCEGLAEAGIAIFDCGLASTPAMFMSTIFEGRQMDGAIMLTASHLPFNRNGMKFFTQKGGLEKQAIKDILHKATTIGAFTPTKVCAPQPLDLMDKYAAHLVSCIQAGTGFAEPLSGLKIVVDAGNGAGGFFVKKVLMPLGADTSGSQFLEPDGAFPNHIPNPEDPRAMQSIIDAVKDKDADVGIIFDTDVDRAGAVDKYGHPINRNRFIALMATITLAEHPGTTIVTDSVTSTGLTWWIEKRLGGKHHRFKRGYKNVINEAIRLNDTQQACWLAMETSGHGALKENYFLDDGAFQIAKILIQVARLKTQGNVTIDEMISELPEPIESIEHRIKIMHDDYAVYGDRVLDELSRFVEKTPGWSLTPKNYEGIHIRCDAENGNGWALLRKSLHDPQLPLNIESDSHGGVTIITKKLCDFLTPFEELILPAGMVNLR